jgi:hypothetical protein
MKMPYPLLAPERPSPARFLLLGMTVALAPIVQGADIYVSPNGSDVNVGTNALKPLQTLQKADSLAKPGDTVWIMAGIYRNAGKSNLLTITKSGTPEAWITWRNYQNDKPELIAEGCWSCIDIQASYIAIEGLTLTGNNDNVRLSDAERNAEVDVAATYAAWKAEGTLSNEVDYSATPNLDKPSAVPQPNPQAVTPKPKSSPKTYEPPNPLYNGSGVNVDCRGNKPLYHHFRLSNLIVRKFGTAGISMMSTDYYTIENCEVHDNAWYSRYAGSGISQLEGRAFDTKVGYHNVIRNNRVYNNKCLVRAYYLGLGLISDGNGIILDSLHDYPGAILVENNFSYSNGGAGIHVFKSNKAQIDIINNTVWQNQQTWRLYDMGAHNAVNVRFLNNIVVADKYRQVNGKPEPGIVYDYNLYSGSPQVLAKGPNDIVADPLFILPSTNRRDANFRLRPNSPALGTGLKTPFAATSDLEGKPRGDKPSRGAYQSF